MNATERIARQLVRDNPGMRIKTGRSHRKIYFRGRLVGILPLTLRTEGLNRDLTRQLRRAGVTV